MSWAMTVISVTSAVIAANAQAAAANAELGRMGCGAVSPRSEIGETHGQRMARIAAETDATKRQAMIGAGLLLAFAVTALCGLAKLAGLI